MNKQGIITVEIDGVEIFAKATWGVFDLVYDNVKLGPADIFRRCLSERWSTREVGYLLYFAIRAADQTNSETNPANGLTYKDFIRTLERMDKSYLASKCAELCNVFVFPDDEQGEIVPDDPIDTESEKKT